MGRYIQIAINPDSAKMAQKESQKLALGTLTGSLMHKPTSL